jgi:hypothetical protein
MRTLTFDQYEFDPPDSEEGLEISIVTKRDHPFPDVVGFASAVLGAEAEKKLPSPIAFKSCDRSPNVAAYLARYAGVTLPSPCDWPTFVVSDDWDDWEHW